MNCLDDWCTEVVQFCRAKSKDKDSPPLMASPSVGNVGDVHGMMICLGVHGLSRTW